MKSSLFFLVMFCLPKLGKPNGPVTPSDSSAVTLATDFNQICQDLAVDDFTYLTYGEAQRCLAKLTTYETLLSTHEKTTYHTRSKLDGGVEAITDAIGRVPPIPSLEKEGINEGNVDNTLSGIKSEVGELEKNIPTQQGELEKARDNVAKITKEYERFEVSALLFLSETFYSASVSSAFFFSVYDDPILCTQERILTPADAHRINPNIDPGIVINFFEFLKLYSLSEEEKSLLRPFVMRSLAASMIDGESCNLTFSNKPDRKRLMKHFTYLYKLGPEFFGHLLLSSSCYARSLELTLSERILETVKTNKAVFDKTGHYVTTYIKDKRFVFGLDSLEEVVNNGTDTVVKDAEVSKLLAENLWARVVFECRVRNELKDWVDKSLQTSEFSTTAIICIGIEGGIMVLLILYLLVRPF